MPRIAELPEADAMDKVAQVYGRIRELLGVESVPQPFLVYGRVQPFLQDFYMNFKKFVYSDGKLDAKTKAAIALSVSAHGGNDFWINYFVGRCQELGFTEEQTHEIMAVAATNAMYNAFFKFRDLSESAVFEGMGVGLRAHTFTGTSLEESLVEIINTVISDINGCRPCTSGHVTRVRELGLSDDAILEAVQCASTMAAGVAFLKSAGY